MGNKITGAEFPLNKIFSSDFVYQIPSYQRPYAWTKDETGVLFDDLHSFYVEQKGKEEDKQDNYFLGSIVLVKRDGDPNSKVIDGQQRLTTLSILFSCLANAFQDKEIKNECKGYIMEPGKVTQGISPQPRLVLREKDQSFFEKYIQKCNIDDLLKLDEAQMLESQRNIKVNSEIMKNKILDSFSDDESMLSFLQFLLTKCFLVVVYTESEESAFRVFTVMNSRGLNLMTIDIVKSKVIGSIDKKEQQYYTDKWEDLEAQTSRNGFNDVFTHTRMIYFKTKPKQNLLKDFDETILKKIPPKELIDDVLEPYAEAYTTLVRKEYVAIRNSEKINQYLFWLNKIDNSDWMPAAIKFMAEHKNDPDYILWFIGKLERLASFLHVTAKDINKRIDRYKVLLEEMEINPDNSLNDPITSIELTNEEKKEFIEALNGEIYKLTGIRRNYVILRLNEFVGDGATKFDFEPTILTIEHVLPQTISSGSEWEKLWPDLSEREMWLNKIANLVPLTRKKNSEAQNYNFDNKKDIYFKGKNGTTTYPLTTQVLSENTWSPNVVAERQKMLIDKFKECWELTYIEQTEQNPNSNDDSTLFYINNKRGANCTGYIGESGFVVREGSQISYEVVDKFQLNYPNAYRLREQLCSDGIIVNRIFQADYEFDSVSLAASIILGRNARGQKEWVDFYGIPYDEKIDKSNESGEFNINDETTYSSIKVGSLAFELFKRVLEVGNISDEEIEKLKTKDYSKQLFSRTDYPILADNREDNRGNSNVIRYRKTPISYNGKNLFITTQWFVGNRNDIIAWYKKHI